MTTTERPPVQRVVRPRGAPEPVPARRAGRAWPVALVGLAATLIASLSFLPIVDGAGWWGTAAVFAAAAVGLAALGRSAGLPAPAAGVLGLVAVPLLATGLAGRGLGIAVLLPTEASAEAVMETVRGASAQIYEEAVPATLSPGIVLLLACGVAVAAVAVDLLAVGLRNPLGAVPVLLALAVVPGKALRVDVDGVLLAVVAVLVLGMIAADRWRRGVRPRLRGLLGAGGVAVVVALVAQAVLPTPAAPAADLPLRPLFGPNADPLIRLGDNLRRGAKTDVLTYTTTSDQDVYLRLAVLESFDGRTWRPNAADGRRLGFGSAPAVPGLDAQDGRRATTRIDPTAAAVSSHLPVPYPARDVSGVIGYAWETRGLALERVGPGAAVGPYTVDSLDIAPSRAELRQAPKERPRADAASLDLPARVPALITRTAKQWTAGRQTDYDRAIAIQTRLKAGQFLYDTRTPAQEGFDGDGLAVIERFLRVKSGYCVHFASTMAVMARVLDIPSRVVVGYQPGERAVVAGRNRYTVSSDDLHAWPELFFSGVGWVRFEPTPSRGAVPAYAPLPQADIRSATPTAAPTRAQPVPTQSALPPEQQRAERARRAQEGVGRSALVALGVLGLLVVAAVPGAVRVLRRRRRLARLGPPGSAVEAWREVIETADDLRLARPPGSSPRAAAASMTAVLDRPAAAALTRVERAFEVQAYGSRDAIATADDVATAVDGLRAAAPQRQRLAALLAPVSLLGRLAPSRLAFRWSPPGSGTDS